MDIAPVELLRAIEAVFRGEPAFSKGLSHVALSRYVREKNRPAAPRPHVKELTPREQEILILIAKGLSNKQIASRMGIGVRTVETHRESFMRKLDIHNTAGLVGYAIARGLVDPFSFLGMLEEGSTG